MGASESKSANVPSAAAAPTDIPQQKPADEKFKEDVRKSANDFKNLVQRNKVMMFSATYCSHCTVAKVRNISIKLYKTIVAFVENSGRHRDPVPEFRGEQGGGGVDDDGDS